jgi:hypothetical protein
MACNVVKRIFDVLKRHFRILVCPPEIDMKWQARLPATLAAIHDFIRDQDPLDIKDNEDPIDPNSGGRTGELAQGLPRAAKREYTNSRRDNFAQQMWVQYQAYQRHE